MRHYCTGTVECDLLKLADVITVSSTINRSSDVAASSTTGAPDTLVNQSNLALSPGLTQIKNLLNHSIGVFVLQCFEYTFDEVRVMKLLLKLLKHYLYKYIILSELPGIARDREKQPM